MAPKVRIGDRWVGDGEPCFIIAEAGSNHNGSLEQAKSLIRVSAEAGADAVKFQTFRASTMYPRESTSVDYLKKLGVDKPIYEIIREMEMPFEWIPELAKLAAETGIMFLSTPFDETCVDMLAPYVPAFKIASYELTHVSLVRYVAKQGKPLIISTGAANLEEISEAVETVSECGSPGVCLMQCTAKYPAPLETINARVIRTLKERFEMPVGLSDHSAHPLYAPLAAVACGANLIEKHFSLSNHLPGPDHAFALEPTGLRSMVEGIRAVEAALGSTEKNLQWAERELVNYRRSVYTNRRIKKGESISQNDVILLRRPGLTEEGIRPSDFLKKVRVARARRDMPPQWLVRWEDIELPSQE